MDFLHNDQSKEKDSRSRKLLIIEDSVVVEKFYDLKEKILGSYTTNADFLDHLLDQESVRFDNQPCGLPNQEQASFSAPPSDDSNSFESSPTDQSKSHSILRDILCPEVEMDEKAKANADLKTDGQLLTLYSDSFIPAESDDFPSACTPPAVSDEYCEERLKELAEARRRKKEAQRKAKQPQKPAKTPIFSCHICADNEGMKHEEIETHFKIIHNGNKPFRCVKCKRTYDKYKQLTKHKTQCCANNGQGFKCDICLKDFVRQRSRDDHMKIHTGDLINCDICNKGFTNKHALMKHQEVHTKFRKYHCENCGKKFSNVTQYNDHKRIHEGVVYSCDVCQKTFSSEAILRGHKRIIHSTQPKQHACQLCGKTTRTASELKMHMVVHDPNRTKTISCETCGKRFFKRAQLNVHLRIHNDERIFVCEVCNKGFYSSQVLKKHRIIHTSARPYKCQYCPSDFNQSGALYTHVKLKHHGLKVSLKRQQQHHQQEEPPRIYPTYANMQPPPMGNHL